MTTASRAATRDDPATGRRRLWAKRLIGLVACWLVVWVLTSWLQMHPSPLGLLAALGAFFSVCWWAADHRTEWDPTDWAGDPIGRRARTSSDSRVSYLRRLIDDAAVHKGQGQPNASATGLQGLLRDLALDRLRRRAAESGAAHLPDDAELLARADPALTHFLTAQPAPPVSRRTVTDIINRIEAL